MILYSEIHVTQPNVNMEMTISKLLQMDICTTKGCWNQPRKINFKWSHRSIFAYLNMENKSNP